MTDELEFDGVKECNGFVKKVFRSKRYGFLTPTEPPELKFKDVIFRFRDFNLQDEHLSLICVGLKVTFKSICQLQKQMTNPCVYKGMMITPARIAEYNAVVQRTTALGDVLVVLEPMMLPACVPQDSLDGRLLFPGEACTVLLRWSDLVDSLSSSPLVIVYLVRCQTLGDAVGSSAQHIVYPESAVPAKVKLVYPSFGTVQVNAAEYSFEKYHLFSMSSKHFPDDLSLILASGETVHVTFLNDTLRTIYVDDTTSSGSSPDSALGCGLDLDSPTPTSTLEAAAADIVMTTRPTNSGFHPESTEHALLLLRAAMSRLDDHGRSVTALSRRVDQFEKAQAALKCTVHELSESVSSLQQQLAHSDKIMERLRTIVAWGCLAILVLGGTLLMSGVTLLWYAECW